MVCSISHKTAEAVGLYPSCFEHVKTSVSKTIQIAKKALADLSEALSSLFYSPRHTFLERIFRTSYFRLAAISDGLLERIVNRIYLSMSESLCNPPVFDELRAERSLSLFRAIGAKIKQVVPRDNDASVHMMHLRASDFEKTLSTFGAIWEKRTVQVEGGRIIQALVISCPNPTPPWREFQEEILAKFGWVQQDLKGEDGQTFSGIITSEHADLIPEDAPDAKVIMFCHSPSTSFIHDRQRTAYYLGLKQDVCMYDSRGIWKSRGSASEAGFYLDAERVLDELMKEEKYLLKDVWIGGKCSGAQVAAHLKAKYHTEGIHFFAEGSFINTHKDFISTLDPISQWVYKRCQPAIRMQGNAKAMYGIEEVDFDIERQWESLSTKDGLGEIVLIHAENDQRLSAASFADFQALALRVNNKVTSLIFHSEDSADTHADSAIFYESIKRDFARCIFTATLSH